MKRSEKGENLNEINDEAWNEEEQAQWNHDSRRCNSHAHSLSFSLSDTNRGDSENESKRARARERNEEMKNESIIIIR